TTPPEKIDDRWAARTKEVDAAAVAGPPANYRDVLGEYLAIQKARIGAAKRPIADRTYHNYALILNAFGNFVVDGQKIADTPLADIGPRHFTAYAATFATWKASGFDSVVSRVSSLFRWAVEMEYIDRFRPGPE